MNEPVKPRNLSRRKMLGLIGGGTVLAATGSALAFVNTRTPTKALEPWDRAGGYDDPRLRALSFALLAPNPHNRQPWLAELNGSDGVTIWRDKERELPVTDPFARQLTIGMGCFVELMVMAAAQEGCNVETDLFPDGEEGPVAVCRFQPGKGMPDPLFAHVMERRSHKGAFEPRDVAQSTVDPLSAYADIRVGGEDRDHLRRIAAGAWMTEMTTREPYMESVELFRIGKREINELPDGIDLGGPMMEALHMTGMFNREIAEDMNHPGVTGAAESDRDIMLASPAFALITTPGNSRLDQIEAGARWMRYNLAATSLGLKTRPVSQALQEYAEVRPFHDEIHERFAPAGHTVQMLGLLGYGSQTPRTPRWRLETRMMDA